MKHRKRCSGPGVWWGKMRAKAKMPFILLVGILILETAGLTSRTNAQGLQLVCDPWPPYQITELGQVKGFSTELVKAVFKEIEQDIRSITAYPWKRALMMVEVGRADALFSANYTEKRAEFAYYPEEPLIRSPWYLWVREVDKDRFKSYEDLKGRRIGVVRSYSYTPAFLRFVSEQAIEDETANDQLNFKKLNAGRVDAVAAEFGNSMHLLKQTGLKGIVPLKIIPIKVDGLYLIFNKKSVSEKLVADFSKALKHFKKSQEYKTMYIRHFGIQGAPF